MARKSYKYDTLPSDQSIRLLCIHKASDESPLHAHVTVHNLGEKPNYIALSYVWGKDEPNLDLLIGDDVLQIRPTLFDALCRLRKRMRLPVSAGALCVNRDDREGPIALRVWADAACINQSDPKERDSQFKIMAKIYESAAHVAIHLGEFEPHIVAEIDFMLRCLTDFCLRTEKGEIPRPKTLDPRELSSYGLPEIADSKWDRLALLLSQHWFRRVWTIQEALVAKRAFVLYGHGEMNLQALLLILDALCRYTALPNSVDRGPTFRDASSMRQAMVRCRLINQLQFGRGIIVGTQIAMQYLTWARAPLMNLLRFTVLSEATDERDYVWALVGISTEANVPELQSNYEETTFTDLCSRVATYMIGKGFGPQLLHCATGQHRDLPSWVPVWGQRIQCGVVEYLSIRDFDKAFCPARNSVPLFELNKEGRELVVKGRLFDRIERIGSLGPLTMTTLKGERERLARNQRLARHLMASLADALKLLQAVDRYPSGESSAEVLYRLMVCDIWNGSSKAPKVLLECLRHWIQFERTHIALCPSVGRLEDCENVMRVFEAIGPPSDAETPYYPEYVTSAMGVAAEGTRYRSEKGYICYGPHHAEVGDIIALIGGCDVPFLLRPNVQKGVYTLVGSCYVHGIMYGEQWKESLARKIRII